MKWETPSKSYFICVYNFQIYCSILLFQLSKLLLICVNKGIKCSGNAKATWKHTKCSIFYIFSNKQGTFLSSPPSVASPTKEGEEKIG